jgi:hypothetical protein
MKTQQIYYLASPYTHKDPSIKKKRAEDVTECAVELLKHNVFTFAPIAYNEPWEKYDLPGNWEFWECFDKSFVERCDGGIIVLMLDGWKESIGVQAEIKYAESLNLPVFYATQDQIMSGDLSFLMVCELESKKSLFCQHSKL